MIPGHLWRMHGTTARMRCRRLAHLLVLQEPEWVIRFWMQLRALLSVFLSKKAAIDIFKDAINKMVDKACDDETEHEMYECVMKK